jgi:Wzt C-terminal domain/Sulfotransferase family
MGIPPRVLFDHVPKTAGMSLHGVLAALVGADRCSPVITGSLGEARAEFARYRCVAAHLSFRPGDDLADLWSLTVLRHPVERALSHLAYLRHQVPASGDAIVQHARSLDLARDLDAGDPRTRELLSNVMVAHFAPLAWNGRDALDDDRRLMLAKQALERFDLVGLTERIDETADLVCRALGARAPVDVPHVNATDRQIDVAGLPADVKRRLAALNALDTELYAHAATLLARARRRVLFGTDAAPREKGDAHAVAPAGDARAPAAPRSFGTREAEILRVDVAARSGLGARVLSGEEIDVRVEFVAHRAFDDLTVGLLVHDEHARLVFATNTNLHGHALAVATGTRGAVTFTFRADLGAGRYIVGAGVHAPHSPITSAYHWDETLARFVVAGNLGWNFAGATKLYPVLAFEGVVPHAAEHAAPLQTLAHMTQPLADFRARITVPAAPAQLPAAQRVALRVDVVNAGSETWPSLGERSVRLAYHWLYEDGRVAVFDGERTTLPRDVAAQGAVACWMTIVTPSAPGVYRLQLSLVQESVAWLEERGGTPAELRVAVGDRG